MGFFLGVVRFELRSFVESFIELRISKAHVAPPRVRRSGQLILRGFAPARRGPVVSAKGILEED